MLQRTGWNAARLARYEAEHRPESDIVSAAVAWSFLRRNLAILLLCTLIGTLVAAAFALTARPHYTAETRLVIDPNRQQGMRDRNIEGAFTLDNAQVESQVAVLKAEKIATMVIEQLKLEHDPDFQPRPGRISALMTWLGWSSPPREPTAYERTRFTMGEFQNNLQVRRVSLSYAIDVAFRSSDAERAAAIANATVQAYMREQLDSKAQAIQLGSTWLDQRLVQLRVQMIAAAREVQEFKGRHDYRIPFGQRTTGPTDPDSVDRSKAPAVSIEDLETQAQTYRRMYETYLQNFTEQVQRQTFPVSDARVVTEATPPLEPSDPRTKLMLSLGAAIGALAGFGVALTRHNLDQRIRSSRQIREDVGIEYLGDLPRIKASEPYGSGPIALTGGAPSMRAGRRRERYFNHIDVTPSAPFNAALMGLRTRISLGVGRLQIKSIGIVSSNAREGKSTIASNLAVLCAQSGSRTLLVDADLGRGQLSQVVAPADASGLLQVLQGSVRLDSALVRDITPNLDFLASGGPPIPLSNERLLGSEVMSTLIQEIAHAYDVVIFDLPALQSSTSALAVGPYLEAMLLVTEWGKTSITATVEGAYWLQAVQARLVGAVIAKADA